MEKLARYADNKDIAIVESFSELDEEIEEKIYELAEQSNGNTRVILEQIKAIEIPVPKDYSDKLKALEDKINEPIEVKINLKIV